MKHQWLYVGREGLEVERQQLLDEGKEMSSLASEFEALTKIDLDQDLRHQPRVNALLDEGARLPTRLDYPYDEPSDLEGIRRTRPVGPRTFGETLDDRLLYDRVRGAWLGRCSGCLLGKPVEGWRASTMWGYLRDLGRYPLTDFFRSDAPHETISKYGISRNRAYVDRVPHMVEDDDLNYTVTGLAVMQQYGLHFTSADVATFWMQNIPMLHTFTAERVAYKNFSQLGMPPESARYRNPYREWIGAQIRADFWGMVALGNPARAAEFAWRDACVSHVKNGIYGAMWVAAMLAAAPFVNDVRTILEVGLTEIPRDSRLAADIRQVLRWRDEAIDYEEANRRIHQQWDETNPHHWTHTNSNAQIVAIGLLWGEGDYERSICRAVQACFDTDCNGATVGSIVGLMQGAQALPAKWTRPLHDTLETCIQGYRLVPISELARETCELIKSVRSMGI